MNLKSIQSLIQSEAELPAIPETVLRVQNLVADPEVKIRELAGMMHTDPVMAGKVLQVSNSVLFGATRRITDLREAIIRIGLLEARNIVYSLSVLRLFESIGFVDQRAFWKHCMGTAYVAQAICRVCRTGKFVENLAYMAGLMHDIGIMVFAHLIPEGYRELLHRVAGDIEDRDHLLLATHEEESYGINHAKVGGLYIRQWWPVDEAVALAVEDHHNDLEDIEELPFLSQVVTVANMYCNSVGIHNGIQVSRTEVDPALFTLLNMDEAARERFEDFASMHLEMAEMFISGEPVQVAS